MKQDISVFFFRIQALKTTQIGNNRRKLDLVLGLKS